MLFFHGIFQVAAHIFLLTCSGYFLSIYISGRWWPTYAGQCAIVFHMNVTV